MYKKSVILRKIRENIAEGAGVYNACEVAGIPYITLWTWRNKRPMIERYMQKMLKQRVQLVEDALYKAALSGNITAMIFYLKNRGQNWQDTPLIDQSEHKHFTVVVKTNDNSASIEQTNRIQSTLEGEDGI